LTVSRGCCQAIISLYGLLVTPSCAFFRRAAGDVWTVGKREGTMNTVAPDIPAGLGYLAAGLAFTAAEVALIRNRHRLARWQLGRMLAASARAPRGTRWMYRRWRDQRWQDEDFRARALVWVWLPPALFLPVAALAMLGSAVAEFRR
jgi:hypothetical protein